MDRLISRSLEQSLDFYVTINFVSLPLLISHGLDHTVMPILGLLCFNVTLILDCLKMSYNIT